MKYLCLICAETVMETMSEQDADEHYEQYRVFVEEIRQSGHYVGSNRLLPRDSACTVRVRNNETTVTDGPFAETKEQLGGYFVIDAADLNEAIRVAARIPGARIGCVEIRPIADDCRTLSVLGKAASARSHED